MMNVHLDPEVFEVVLNGTKKVEVRVNDEKRRKLKIGDTLIFLKRPEEVETIEATVTDLNYYDNFEDLVECYSMDELYLSNYTKADFLKLLKKFYSDDEIKEYGVVAIRFEKK